MTTTTNTTPARRERFRFFLEHAGYCTPPGRAACALGSARAEELLERAEELEVARVEVLDDDFPYDAGDFCTLDDAARKFSSGEWTGPYVVGITTTEGHSAGVGGVVVGSAGESDPYIRVLRAELAAELEDELRQAIGDELDHRKER